MAQMCVFASVLLSSLDEGRRLTSGVNAAESTALGITDTLDDFKVARNMVFSLLKLILNCMITVPFNLAGQTSLSRLFRFIFSRPRNCRRSFLASAGNYPEKTRTIVHRDVTDRRANFSFEHAE